MIVANGTMVAQVLVIQLMVTQPVVDLMMTQTSQPVQLAALVEGEQISYCIDVQMMVTYAHVARGGEYSMEGLKVVEHLEMIGLILNQR